MVSKAGLLQFVEAEESEIDVVAGRLHEDVEGSVLVSKGNIASFFGGDGAILTSTKVVIPGYLVKAGVATSNTEVALLICYLASQARLRKIDLIFVAPSRSYLDRRIRRSLELVEELNGV